MKFYKIEPCLDLREIGDFPQVQNFKSGYDSRRPESCSRIGRFDSEVPAIDFDFDGMQLTNKAKLTDYLCASYMSNLSGLLVNNSLLSFMQSKRVVDNLVYPVGLYRNDQKLPDKYFWIHYTRTYPEFINFKDSRFFLNHSEAKYKEVIIHSHVDYLEKQDASQYIIDSKHLVIKTEFAKEIDFLRIGVIKYETYVNEKVKNEMDIRGFTGMTYELADYLIFE